MRHALNIVGFVVGLVCWGNIGQAQEIDPACTANKDRLAAITKNATAQPNLAEFNTLLSFLDTVKDDPTDCVTTNAVHQVAEIERKVITLRIDGKNLQPDWILHCNEVDMRSAVCTGPELDTSSLLPEDRLTSRRASGVSGDRMPPTAQLRMQPNYGFEVLGVYGGSGGALQNGKVPARLFYKGLTINLSKLQNLRDPTLILIVRRNDGLGYRKIVWHIVTLSE